jgi:peptidoglycan/xylan/chitin deacetylase (PgdA/CDA1 family)
MPFQSGLVLLYHRVADRQIDPQLLAVSPRHFAEHMEVLRERYEPVRLGALVDRGWRMRSKKPPVAVTFDDGYADNFHRALPILTAANVPATFFVVSGQVGRQEEFWWDELERIFLATPDLPERLELEIGAAIHRWPIGSGSDTSSDAWSVLSEGVASPRQAAYRELCDLMRPESISVRESTLARLRTWAGLTPAGRPADRALSEDEVIALAADDLAEIGSHTMTHPVLSEQPLLVQMLEIDGSKRALEDFVGKPIRSFSYPFGGRVHYTPRTVGLVKGAGYALACSNFPGPVHWRTARHEIPRFLVRNWSADEFARRLDAQLRQ